MRTAQQASPGALTARSTTVRAFAGAAAGFLMVGIGGRIAMRISAQIDRSAHGRITENGEIVGEFTLGGTIAFIIFLGLFGALVVGFMWTLVAPWLPAEGPSRRMAAFVVGAAIGGQMAVDGGNRDFRILDPEWLQAAIYVALAGLTGVVAAVFQPRVERRLAAPQPGIVIGYWAVVIVGALLGIPMLGLFFMTGDDCACVSPPWLVGLLLIALGIVWLVRFVVEAKGRTVSTGLITSGRIVLFAAVVAGLFHLGGEIAHFT